MNPDELLRILRGGDYIFGDDCADLIEQLQRKVANANKLVLVFETFLYDRAHITEGGVVAQIQAYMTDQEVQAPFAYNEWPTEEPKP